MTFKGKPISLWGSGGWVVAAGLAAILALAERGYNAPAALNQERITALSDRLKTVEESSKEMATAYQAQSRQLAVVEIKLQAIEAGVNTLLARRSGR